MEKNNGKIAIAIVAMFVVALSVVGFTYAYFTATVTGNDTSSATITAGKLVGTWTGGGTGVLNANNIVPGWISDGNSYYDPTHAYDAGQISACTKLEATPTYASSVLLTDCDDSQAKKAIDGVGGTGLVDPISFTVTNDSDNVEGNNPGETIYYAVLLDTTAVVKLPSDAVVKATLYEGDVATLNGTKVKDAQTIALLDAEPIVLSNDESLAFGESASYYILVEYVNDPENPQEQGLSFTVEAKIVGIAQNEAGNWVDENGKTIIKAS